MSAERRQHPRQNVRDGEIEIFSRVSKIFGKLRNISHNGLAFHYTPRGGQKAETDTIDIMATGPARFYISGLTCRKIYDISVLAEDQTFTGTEIRLCGLEFIKLEDDHQLRFFLRNYYSMPCE